MKTPIFIGLRLVDGEWHPAITYRSLERSRQIIDNLKELFADMLKQMDEEGW